MADKPVSVKLEQPLRSKEVKVRPPAKQIWKEKYVTVTDNVTEIKNTNQEGCQFCAWVALV